MKGKFLIIFCTIFIVVGVGLGMFGMTKLDWNFKELDTRVFTEMTYVEQDGQPKINKVQVDASFPVSVVRGDTVSLKYYNEQSNQTTITLGDDGVLHVDNNYIYKWSWNMFKFKESSLIFVLTMPSDVSLEIDAPNATIQLDGMDIASLKLDSINTNLTITNSHITSLELNSVNTSLNFTDSSFDDVKIDSTNLTMRNTKFTANNMTIETINATLHIADSSFYTVKIDSTNLTMRNAHFTATNLSVDTINATLEMNIDGKSSEYTVIVDTINNSKNFIPQQGTNPLCIINIDSVNISGYLKFTE